MGDLELVEEVLRLLRLPLLGPEVGRQGRLGLPPLPHLVGKPPAVVAHDGFGSLHCPQQVLRLAAARDGLEEGGVGDGLREGRDLLPHLQPGSPFWPLQES